MSENYTAVIRLEGECWLAECPEAGLGAQGQGVTPEEALVELKEAIGVERFASQRFATEAGANRHPDWHLHRARRLLQEKPPIGTSAGELYRSGELWCDSELMEILKNCSKRGDVAEWNHWRKANRRVWIWLQGAELYGFYLKTADLNYVHFENATFAGTTNKDHPAGNLRGALLREAHLEKANFTYVHLQSAQLCHSYLAGTFFWGSHFESSDFRAAFVDEKTSINECYIDDKTDFTMVGLDSARIEPRLLAALKTNIRRITWKNWYDECKVKGAAKQKTSRPDLLFKRMASLLGYVLIVLILLPLLLFVWPMWGVCRFVDSIAQYGFTASFMRLFWWISDYGSSTKRILKTFFSVALIFALLYGLIDWYCPGVLKDIAPEATYKVMHADPPMPYTYPQNHPVVWALQVGAFALATMVTLGFGGINVRFVEASPIASGSAVVLVAFNLLCGYFLLAVLVTRMGILFQSLGPEQEVERGKVEKEKTW